MGFLNRDVAGGILSSYAGFGFTTSKKPNMHGVGGNNGYNNKLLDYLYQRYKSYTYNDGAAHFGPYSRHIGTDRANAFLDGKKLRPFNKSLISHVGDSLKTSLKNSWSPFSSNILKPSIILKPKEWFKSGIINKDFFAKSNMLKLSGPIGYLTTAANSIYDYGWGAKKDTGILSTNFAADLTTDLGIGVISTGVGSVASSLAAGAVAGSVVPGVGTVIGAAAGLAGGLVTTYLINGTATGRNLKKKVSNGIKKAYDWVGGGLKKLGGLFG